jgi:hypothetical protein
MGHARTIARDTPVNGVAAEVARVARVAPVTAIEGPDNQDRWGVSRRFSGKFQARSRNTSWQRPSRDPTGRRLKKLRDAARLSDRFSGRATQEL